MSNPICSRSWNIRLCSCVVRVCWETLSMVRASHAIQIILNSYPPTSRICHDICSNCSCGFTVFIGLIWDESTHVSNLKHLEVFVPFLDQGMFCICFLKWSHFWLWEVPHNHRVISSRDITLMWALHVSQAGPLLSWACERQFDT